MCVYSEVDETNTFFLGKLVWVRGRCWFDHEINWMLYNSFIKNIQRKS